MLSPLPRRSGWVHRLLTSPAVSAFPDMAVGSARALSFSRLARRSLALRPAHSRCHRISWHASPKASTVSLPPQLLRLLPAGAVAGWDRPPLGKRRLPRRTPKAEVHLAEISAGKRSFPVRLHSAVSRETPR